jgi:hypothetical protein
MLATFSFFLGTKIWGSARPGKSQLKGRKSKMRIKQLIENRIRASRLKVGRVVGLIPTGSTKATFFAVAIAPISRNTGQPTYTTSPFRDETWKKTKNITLKAQSRLKENKIICVAA